MRVVKVLFALSLFLLTSCATVGKQPLVYTPGSSVETLSASISLSVWTSAGNVSGNGLMIYRRPDQFHFVMLSPFGSTVLEAFALGDRLTLVYPSQSLAYSGHFDELPDGSGMQGWRLLRWVMDAKPSDTPTQSGTIQRMDGMIGAESVTFASGLVTAKETAAGDRVSYRGYALVNGVPLAAELDMKTMSNDRIKLVLEEPEVNTPLDKIAFAPRLDGMKLLPLSAMPRQSVSKPASAE